MTSIKPRDLRFDLGPALAAEWNDDDWFSTAFFNSMSVLFPYGEKSFIDSVRAHETSVSDGSLREAVRGFMAQEYVHRREHQRFNELLCQLRGYDLEYLEGAIRGDAKTLKDMDPLFWLATTVAYEHLTATIAGQLLKQDGWIKNANPDVAQVWRWHAVEEIEHKSVAFDVYKAAGGTQGMLRKAMVLMSWEFLVRYQLRSLMHMYRRDKPPFWRTLGQAMRFLFSRGGLIRGNWSHYWKFFRKDFHPEDIDDTAVLDRAIDLYGLAH